MGAMVCGLSRVQWNRLEDRRARRSLRRRALRMRGRGTRRAAASRSATFRRSMRMPPSIISPRAMANCTNVLLAGQAVCEGISQPQTAGPAADGRPGTGKTHLAVAAFRAILAKGFEGLFFDYQNLLDRIRSSYDPTSQTSDKETYRVAMDKEVLLLDDLGAHRVTDWVEDTVTSIITARCNHRKPLIATTNLIDPEARYVGREPPPASRGSPNHAGGTNRSARAFAAV